MEKILYLKECLVNGQMDYVGQKEAYNAMLYGIWACGAVGFVHGYVAQSFLLTSYYIMGASLFFSIICIPSWPYFISHKVEWQASPVELAEVPKRDSKSGDESEKEPLVDEKEKSKAKKRTGGKKKRDED